MQKTYEHNFTSMPDQKSFDSVKSLLTMLKRGNVTNDEIRRILRKFIDFFKANYQKRLQLTAGLTIGQYLDYPNLSVGSQEIMNSYIGIIVAARTQCDAFAIMCLFEGLGCFGSPKTAKWIKNSGPSWC